MPVDNGKKPDSKDNPQPPVDDALEPPDDEDVDQPPRLSEVEGDPNAPYPSQSAPLGVLPPHGNDNAAKELFEGDPEFEKWSVRGNRKEATALAMVAMEAENVSLVSDTYPVRGSQMYRILTEDGDMKTLLQPREKKELSKIEFGVIAMILGGILAFLFVVGIVFSK